jgi:predicted AAA+ superfamily ATPase
VELLTGRNLKINIHTLSFSDYLRFSGIDKITLPASKEREATAKQYIHEKKIYIIDTGLANAVSFRFSEDKGRMLETVVFGALKKHYNGFWRMTTSPGRNCLSLE